jgi:hypothetical protein
VVAPCAHVGQGLLSALAKPGQPTPYNWFPYAALIVVAVAAVYAFVLNSRDGTLADRVGSLVADE